MASCPSWTFVCPPVASCCDGSCDGSRSVAALQAQGWREFFRECDQEPSKFCGEAKLYAHSLSAVSPQKGRCVLSPCIAAPTWQDQSGYMDIDEHPAALLQVCVACFGFRTKLERTPLQHQPPQPFTAKVELVRGQASSKNIPAKKCTLPRVPKISKPLELQRHSSCHPSTKGTKRKATKGPKPLNTIQHPELSFFPDPDLEAEVFVPHQSKELLTKVERCFKVLQKDPRPLETGNITCVSRTVLPLIGSSRPIALQF